jgi:murein DD-endopeptidase MepM/ murein hydrolase activator NlpD
MGRPLACTSRILLFVVATSLLFLASCARDGTPAPPRPPGQTPAALVPPATHTPAPTNSPTATPSPTATNTPTPTPTATAPPAAISGDPRSYAMRPPEAQPGAPCGVVDFFDFPVGPPHAVNVNRGGTDFNVYRERYSGFHAGEDWSGPNGRSLGSPVYSIGHGRVIYAHPLGWGADQGVLIVQHVLPGGSTILSFYGHLDPPSVTMRGGECVARGDKVGEIGDPRGRPHLHFEIRNNRPGEPGPGYWGVDPTLAGWFPPSITIWGNRLAASPGYLWARPPVTNSPVTSSEVIGLLPGDVLVLLQQGRLTGMDAGDGSTRWTQPDPPTPTPEPESTPNPTRAALEVAMAAPVSAVLDEVEPLLYAVDRRGRLDAYATEGEEPGFESLWRVELEITGAPALYALPGGGVVAAGLRQIVALNASGHQLWSQLMDESTGTAIRAGDYLFLPTGRSEPTLWSLDELGPTPWPGLPPGTPVGGEPGQPLWLYGREGIYRLDPEERSAELVMLLPRALYRLATDGNGNAVLLPDGGLLVAHHDAYDRRLLRFDAAGELRWERSYREASSGEARLALLDGQVYLALVEEGPTTLVTLYSVDLETGSLLRLFAGGTRTGIAQNTWLLPGASGSLLLNIGGGHLVALDAQAATAALSAP